LTVRTQRIAHLTDRNWLLRLYDEFVRPARAAGHRLWLGGHECPVWRQLWENFLDRYLEP
jgi:hypothetical protein